MIPLLYQRSHSVNHDRRLDEPVDSLAGSLKRRSTSGSTTVSPRKILRGPVQAPADCDHDFFAQVICDPLAAARKVIPLDRSDFPKASLPK